MCGRYALHASPEVVALQFGLASVPAFAPRYNIAPAAAALIVKPGGAALARWGLKGGRHNARAETLAVKPSFRRPSATPDRATSESPALIAPLDSEIQKSLFN